MPNRLSIFLGNNCRRTAPSQPAPPPKTHTHGRTDGRSPTLPKSIWLRNGEVWDHTGPQHVYSGVSPAVISAPYSQGRLRPQQGNRATLSVKDW